MTGRSRRSSRHWKRSGATCTFRPIKYRLSPIASDSEFTFPTRRTQAGESRASTRSSVHLFLRFHSALASLNWITKHSRGGFPKFAPGLHINLAAFPERKSSASLILRNLPRRASTSTSSWKPIPKMSFGFIWIDFWTTAPDLKCRRKRRRQFSTLICADGQGQLPSQSNCKGPTRVTVCSHSPEGRDRHPVT